MGNYDRIIKENLEAIFLSLAEKYLGFGIRKQRRLDTKLQTTLEREPDFLAKIEGTNGERFILQLEFQVEDEPDMHLRMAEYRAILQRKYKLPVRQFVFWMGRRKEPKMPSQLPKEMQISGFRLANLRQRNWEEVLSSQLPEEVLLAILADFGDARPSKVLRALIKRLAETSGNKTVLQKYAKQLTVLARLRNLEEETTKIVKDMPITYDITKDKLYLKGKEEGREKGREEGKAKGRREAMFQLIAKMLKKGKLSRNEIAEMLEVPSDTVKKVQEMIRKGEI